MLDFRRASQKDGDSLAAIHLAALTKAMPSLPRIHTVEEGLEYFAKLVTLQNCWAADVFGETVGFIAVQDSWVNHLYILPQHQNKGIGSRLLGIAKEISSNSLQLWTFQDNRRARAFYKKHGFVEVEFTDGEGNQERTPDVRLTWTH